MSLESVLLENIIPFIGNYFLIAVLVGTIVSGNLFVIFISTLSGQGIFPVWKVFLISLVGVLIADFIWFNIGKTRFITNIIKTRHMLYNYKHIKNLLNKSSEKNKFLWFFTSKFIYGTRILTLMYVGRRKMKLKDFLVNDSLASILWVIILVSLGWLAGKGFDRFLNLFNSFRGGLTTFLLIIVLLYIIWLLISRLILNKEIN